MVWTWHFTWCREIQKATQNFTTTLGQGSFGTVYKATMPTGEVVAVKVLAPNSKQGEKEFQTEVYSVTWFVGFRILYILNLYDLYSTGKRCHNYLIHFLLSHLHFFPLIQRLIHTYKFKNRCKVHRWFDTYLFDFNWSD